MKTRLINNAGIRLVLLCTLIATVSFIRKDSVAYSAASWDDGYYNAVFSCDNSYSGTLGSCRSEPSYPFSPDEEQCRIWAAFSYGECLSGIEDPLPQLDFCDMARAAAENCNMQYGVEGATPDYSAWMECRLASKIDQCL